MTDVIQTAVLLAVVMCAAGCGDKTDDTEETGAASETASEATSEGSTAPTSGDTTSTPTTGGGECVDPSTTTVGPAVAVKIRNDTAADLFVRGGGFCGEPTFTLRRVDDTEVTTTLGLCPVSCGEQLASQSCGCPDIGCVPGLVRITPGGVYTDSWSGAEFTTTVLPAECVEMACVGSACGVQMQAAPATYKLSSVASATATCEFGCDCTPSPEGWCAVEGTIADESIATAPLDYPAETAAMLVFQ